MLAMYSTRSKPSSSIIAAFASGGGSGGGSGAFACSGVFEGREKHPLLRRRPAAVDTHVSAQNVISPGGPLTEDLDLPEFL
jgi:hypothetical protein